MRAMTIEELLMKEDDKTLLDIYDELESGVMPATGYTHEYIRKVNRLINEGRLCSVPGKYRTVYLPTVSKALYRELARRYAMHCYNAKAPKPKAKSTGIKVTPLERNDEQTTCERCNCDGFDPSDLHSTDMGMLCDKCISDMRRNDEAVFVYD